MVPVLVGEATIQVKSDTASIGPEMRRAVGKAAADTEKDLTQRFSDIGKKASVRLTVPIVGAFTFAAKAAADERKQMTQLAATLQQTTGATKAQVAATEAFIGKMQNATGVADSQLRPAFSRLASSTRNITEAQRLLAIATDVSVARNLNLEAVATALGRASQGNVTALGRLGVATKDAAGNTKNFDEILQDLEKTFGGIAEKAADPVAKLQARFGDAVEEIGFAVLPAFEKLGGAVVRVAETFGALPSGAQTVTVIGLAALAAVGPIATLGANVLKLRTALVAARSAALALQLSLGIGVALVAGAAFGRFVNNVLRDTKAMQVSIKELAQATDRELVQEFRRLAAEGQGFNVFAKALDEGTVQARRLVNALNAAGIETASFERILSRAEAKERDVASSTAAATDEVQDLGGAAQDAVGPFDRLTGAVDRVRTAIDNVLSPTLDAQEAADRFQGAIHAVKEQLDEMKGKTDSTGESQRRLRDALRDAERAAIAEVEALVRTGQVAPQAVPQELFNRINGLKQLFPGLRGEIDSVLGQLRNLSSLRYPNLEALRIARFGSFAERAGARPTARQHGGPVLPGEVYQVGEAGPELAVFPRAGHIVPADVSAQLLDAVRGMRGGNSYSFSGAWPLDPRHFARAIVREQNWALR